MGRIIQQAIGLLTGGAEGAGDAQDPSRTIASERALNGAIVAADISQSFEEYLEIFDHFYAEDIEGTTDTMKEPVHGKAAVRTRLAGFLIPLHVFAEIGGVSVSIQSSPIRVIAGIALLAETFEPRGTLLHLASSGFRRAFRRRPSLDGGLRLISRFRAPGTRIRSSGS